MGNASIILLLYIESIQIKREYVNTFIDYCILALWLEKSEIRQKKINKETIKTIIIDTQEYYYTTSDNVSLTYQIPNKEIVTKIMMVKEESILNEIANDMKHDGEYLQSAYLYLYLKQPLKALEIVNNQITKFLKKTIHKTNEFNQYVDLGNYCKLELEALESKFSNNHVSDKSIELQKMLKSSFEIMFYEFLQNYSYALIQDKRGRAKEVIRIMEKVGILQNYEFLSESIQFNLVLERIPEVIIIVARNLITTNQRICKSSQDHTLYTELILNSLLKSVHKWDRIPPEIIADLNTLRIAL